MIFEIGPASSGQVTVADPYGFDTVELHADGPGELRVALGQHAAVEAEHVDLPLDMILSLAGRLAEDPEWLRGFYRLVEARSARDSLRCAWHPCDRSHADCGPDVAAELFRAAMSSVSAPVTVVTALEHGRPHGTTVSAFASLSLDPPLVTIALDRDSDLLKIVRRTRRIGVNVLGAEQAAVALAFARKGLEKFAGQTWELCDGLPRLAAVPGWLACTVWREVVGGDHTILIGRVVSADERPAQPLTYHRRTFGTQADAEFGTQADAEFGTQADAEFGTQVGSASA
jgi:flavin reductase (DIM6/NTAB) family NADH-FMN oxidoreductase RutF